MVQDPPALNQPEVADIVGRDPERTPMQWDTSPHAGFCGADVTPWLPVAEDYFARNVAVQEQDPTSPLALFRAVTALRRREPALAAGTYASVDVGAKDIYAYVRESGASSRFLVVLNFGTDAHEIDLSAVAESGEIVVATDMVRRGAVSLDALPLRGDEGLVLRIAGLSA
jgi:alpha-glucosidase